RSLVTGNGDPNLASQSATTSLGGGIYFFGTSLTVTDSTVSANQANNGGGVYVSVVSSAAVSITNSTLRDNKAWYAMGGGGLYLNSGKATLTNCTVSQNSGLGSGNVGGGIFLRGTTTLTLINSSVANNSGGTANPVTYGGGIAIDSLGTVNARNSIIAGNRIYGSNTPAQFQGTLTSQGYNLISSSQGMTITGNTTGNIVPAGSAVIDAKLGPLANNGGPTMTHALLTGSPAINAGNTATSPNTDQRGAARVGTADMGAFELNNSANGGTFRAQLPDAVVQTPYSYTLVPNNGAFTYSLSAGALPNGITLTTNPAQNGVVALSGTPTAVGTYDFSITASNGTNTAVTNYTMVVVPGPPIIPTVVVSRQLHNNVPYDINLPLTGTPGVECRSGGATNAYQLILSFAGPITYTGATVTSGTGSVTNLTGTGTNSVTINLSGVTNAQRVTVTLASASNGTATNNVAVTMGVLMGDTNSDGVVNSADATITRNYSGQATNATNFRADYNTDGAINSADATIARINSGSGLPGAAAVESRIPR
ncbi:MAG: dockerin type I repeat-containing protein, partial [Verrucomicrobiota bacterium]|nr:dockerin type I repeat-containing protein [Verrucomicrobiota bacterium]